MFARIFALLPLALLVSASHLEARGQCNNGSVNCCNNVQSVSQSQDLLAKYDLVNVAAGISGLVGSDCTPITAIGTGNGCAATQQTVCCTNDYFDGAVNLGCNPISAVA